MGYRGATALSTRVSHKISFFRDLILRNFCLFFFTKQNFGIKKARKFEYRYKISRKSFHEKLGSLISTHAGPNLIPSSRKPNQVEVIAGSKLQTQDTK